MSLEQQLDNTLGLLLAQKPLPPVTSEQLIQCMDLTLLDETADVDALLKIKDQALTHNVAAVCVYPQHLEHFYSADCYELATVINFPSGNEHLEDSLAQIELAKKLGATEIDYVLPYSAYLQGKHDLALDACKAVYTRCESKNLSCKIILETGVFPDMAQIYQVSMALINQGCDFLKTSTGKASQGATLNAVFAMLSAIKDSESDCGLKVSGGVKTPQQAQNYAQMAELVLGKRIDKSWFRIGASSLLNELANPEL